MENENEELKQNFTYAVVLRGDIGDINTLSDFIKKSDLRIAHSQLSQNKLWIKGGEDE